MTFGSKNFIIPHFLDPSIYVVLLSEIVEGGKVYKSGLQH